MWYLIFVQELMMKDKLKEQLSKLTVLDGTVSPTDAQEDILYMLEQIIGGCMVDDIINDPDDLDSHVDTIINGDEHYDAFRRCDIEEIVEVMGRWQ